jgi:hypothetical protein
VIGKCSRHALGSTSRGQSLDAPRVWEGSVGAIDPSARRPATAPHGAAHEHLGLSGPGADWIADLDLSNVGFTVVALFVAVRVAAISYWRLARVEHCWSGAAVLLWGARHERR